VFLFRQESKRLVPNPWRQQNHCFFSILYTSHLCSHHDITSWSMQFQHMVIAFTLKQHQIGTKIS